MKKTVTGSKSAFSAGSVVVLYLREPPGKIWGVIRSLDATGASVEGVDLRSFEEFLRGVASKEIGPHDLSLAFYPLLRVDKILLDRGSDNAPSLQDQFRARVGMDLIRFLGAGSGKA
jgi:hypothetical protein